MIPPQDAKALDGARARFLGGLAEKAGQMRELIDRLIDRPWDPEHRTALRSHLHALYTSARVYRVDDLADALKEEIEHIDSLPLGDLADGAKERLRSLPAAYEKFSPSPETGTRSSLQAPRKRTRKKPSAESLPAPLGSLTVEQLADRVALEVRNGLVRSLEEGTNSVVDLGDGSEVLAPLLSAIGRIQATIAERSEGSVRFKTSEDVPLITVTGSRESGSVSDPSFSLEGYTVLIADDDPAVIWFFSNLLRELGAHVMEALDGFEALRAAHRQTPDLVLADILMPRLDGLALCRALANDPILESVPIILLSWREDFLERMRELRAGAEAYLRKEASSQQILQKVRETLEPRLFLEQQLNEEGDVTGRIEEVGVVLLLRAVSSLRPDAQVSLRDPWSEFELTYRKGRLVEATQTAIDGSFVRGAQALRQLLGGSGGRFTVTQSNAAKSYVDDLEDAFAEAVEDVRATVDAVRGSELGKIANVELDLLVLTSFLRSSPTDVRVIAEQLAAGRAPMELIDSGEASLELVESVLSVLARRAGVDVVRGRDGEDRVALARARRSKQADWPAGVEAEPSEAGLRWFPASAESTETSGNDVRSGFDRVFSSADNHGVDELIREAARTEAALSMQAAPANSKLDPNLPNVRTPGGLAPIPPTASYADRPGLLGWAFVVVIVTVAALLTWRTYEIRAMHPVRPGVDEQPSGAIELGPIEIRAVPDPEASPLAAFAGALQDGLPPGLSAVPEEGALVVESASPDAAAVVYLNDREVGPAPQALIVPYGRHEVALRIHDDMYYRFTYVHPGKTRIVRFP